MPNPFANTLTDLERSKLAKGLCRVRFCRKKPLKGRTLCAKHKHERTKETNPIGYFFQVLRNNAKRRGKDFTLTLEDFKEFLKDYPSFMSNKGKSKLSLCIDRIRNEQGYTKDNIRAITLQQNSWKRNYVDYGNRDSIPCPF